MPRFYDNEKDTDEILVLDFYEKPDKEESKTSEEGFIIVGGNNRRIQVYSIRTGTLEAQMEGHEDSVTCMVIDGNFLITGSDDCTIRLFDLNHFTPTQVLGNHKGPIQDLIFL